MAESTWVNLRRDVRDVAVLTINNPAKLNTLNTAVMNDLIAAAEQLAKDRDLRAVVLRGAGDRAFIGGADIGEMVNLGAGSARAFITLVHRSCDVFRRMPVPVIARIEGWTLGAGLEVAAACDMRVASSGARFGMPEVRVGLPSVVEAALLPGLIGWGRTRRLLLTGEAIDAATALAWGFIEQTAPPEELDGVVDALLDGILASGPRAVRLQKALIEDWQAMAVDAAIQHGIDGFVDAWASDEPRRMMNDFLQRQHTRRR